MASYTVNTAKHATLASSTVDTVYVDNPTSFLLIMNRASSGNPIFYTFGDPEKGVAEPTVAGDDSYVVGAGQTVSVPADGSPQLVKLISNADQPYSIVST